MLLTIKDCIYSFNGVLKFNYSILLGRPRSWVAAANISTVWQKQHYRSKVSNRLKLIFIRVKYYFSKFIYKSNFRKVMKHASLKMKCVLVYFKIISNYSRFHRLHRRPKFPSPRWHARQNRRSNQRTSEAGVREVNKHLEQFTDFHWPLRYVFIVGTMNGLLNTFMFKISVSQVLSKFRWGS